MALDEAEQSLRDGDLDTALARLQEAVRRDAADAALRVFLFQLLCVRGEWERAQTQLKVASDLDAKALPMAQMYGEAIRCELFRREVFAGRRSPLVFGEPDAWIALLVESVQRLAGDREGAAALRAEAFERAPASAGTIDGQPFEWIADADMRVGPVCEAVINGRYYWVPFARLAAIDLDAPVDLRDVVWMPARFKFANGGDAVGLIPTRYPGSESDADARLRLARQTVWDEVAPDTFTGRGQRMWTTDAGEYPLMDVRQLIFQPASTATPEAPQ